MIEVEGGGNTPLYSGCWWYALLICSLTEYILRKIEVEGGGNTPLYSGCLWYALLNCSLTEFITYD